MFRFSIRSILIVTSIVGMLLAIAPLMSWLKAFLLFPLLVVILFLLVIGGLREFSDDINSEPPNLS